MAVQVPERPHAILGPSGWDRWGTCPGSVPLTEHLPNISSSYAREGTAAHQLLEDCLTLGFDAEELIGREYEVEGEIFIVDMEMADAVNTAIGWIREEIVEENGDILLNESAVPIAHLTGETDAQGSADIIGICNGGKTLVVMDYKHGEGVQVYASTLPDNLGHQMPNGQMAMYGLGTLYMLAPVYEDIETVKLVVLQPRKEWHDVFELSVSELLTFGEVVTEAAGRVELNRQVYAEGNTIDLVPTVKGCQFCDAKSFCPALKETSMQALAPLSSAADFEDLSMPKKVASLVIDENADADKLAEAMRAVPLLEIMMKAVRAEVERRLFDGQEVPGYKVVEGKKGNRAWVDPEQAADELTKSGRLKASEAYKRTPISPTEAEKKLKKRPKIWAQLAPLITQAEGKPSVAPEDDPRPPLAMVPAPEDFEDLTAQPAQLEQTETVVDPFS